MWRAAALAMTIFLVALTSGCGGGGSQSGNSTTSATGTSTSLPASTVGVPGSSALTSSISRPAISTSSSAPLISTTAPSTTTTAAPRRNAAALGFGEVAFTVAPAGGTAASFCALLAETAAQQARGLMGRRDLAGYDAMVFPFPDDTTAQFYMRNVPVGLSIAWFTADGRFVSSTDMAPCADQDGCPLYSAAGPYRYALEVLGGGLGALGIGEGSVLKVGGACRP